MRIRHETFTVVLDAAYVFLMTNLMLSASCVPLLVIFLLTDPAETWPLLALLAPMAGPALCAVFTVLARYTDSSATTVVATFSRAWRATWRRATLVTAAATALIVVLGVDIAALWGRPAGAVAIPVLAVTIVLVAATTLLTLVLLVERPDVRLRDAARACAYLAVRRWYLTAISLAVLTVLQALLVSRPAIAAGLAAAPLLYVVWANSRYTFTPVKGRS
ncbi:DUF624 domain-containing protein [Actinoplanes sp. GCM10030250]|uniref:DUF624 domain-containing protein n=1 Tax=Actinoplanes sp. GCM10030250 TaxID=3273376 RepID=UPI00361C29DE